MVAEWRLNGDGKGRFQSHFSHHSVTIQSTEWQQHFSDLSVSLIFKNKITPDVSEPGSTNQRESTLTIGPQGPLNIIMNILCSVC